MILYFLNTKLRTCRSIVAQQQSQWCHTTTLLLNVWIGYRSNVSQAALPSEAALREAKLASSCPQLWKSPIRCFAFSWSSMSWLCSPLVGSAISGTPLPTRSVCGRDSSWKDSSEGTFHIPARYSHLSHRISSPVWVVPQSSRMTVRCC